MVSEVNKHGLNQWFIKDPTLHLQAYLMTEMQYSLHVCWNILDSSGLYSTSHWLSASCTYCCCEATVFGWSSCIWDSHHLQFVCRPSMHGPWIMFFNTMSYSSWSICGLGNSACMILSISVGWILSCSHLRLCEWDSPHVLFFDEFNKSLFFHQKTGAIMLDPWELVHILVVFFYPMSCIWMIWRGQVVHILASWVYLSMCLGLPMYDEGKITIAPIASMWP